jgi:hypothetical protein
MTGGERMIGIGQLRIAAAIGALFSGVSVWAGTRVLTGLDVPGYVVLPWLVLYNVVAGLFGVAVGLGLWLIRRWAIAAAARLAVAHLSVLLALIALRASGGVVANDSLGAMSLRAIVWVVIALVARRAAPLLIRYAETPPHR